LANLGFVLFARGQREDARAAYNQALTLDPNLRIARAALVRLDAPAAAAGPVTPLRRRPEPLAGERNCGPAERKRGPGGGGQAWGSASCWRRPHWPSRRKRRRSGRPRSSFIPGCVA